MLPPGAKTACSMYNTTGEGHNTGLCSTEIGIKYETGGLRLAVDLLATLSHHIWWRSLQDPDAAVDISTGTRQG